MVEPRPVYVKREIGIDGVIVYLYRSLIDGRIVIDIDSSESHCPQDSDDDNCPLFRLMINEHIIESEEL